MNFDDAYEWTIGFRLSNAIWVFFSVRPEETLKALFA